MRTSIPENRSTNNVPVLCTVDSRPSPQALALAMLARRHRVGGAVAVVILELAGIGREVR